MSVPRVKSALLIALVAVILASPAGCLAADDPPASRPVLSDAKVGYTLLPAGKVRIWDLGKKYTYKHYWPSKQWKDRANWVQVPYGKADDYKFRGDCMLEGPNFWVSLHSSRHDAVFLYAKMDAAATPSRHNEIYKSWFAPVTLPKDRYGFREKAGRLRCYGMGAAYSKIIKYTPTELIVESGAFPYTRGGAKVEVVTTYRILGGCPWLEIKPVRKASEQGMHGETRLAVCPEAGENSADAVGDSWKNPPNNGGCYAIEMPTTSRMMLDLIIDADIIWVMTWPNPAKARPYNINCRGGWPAGWQHIGEGTSPKIISAPFALFGDEKEPVYIGVFVHGYWMYQKIDRPVKAGQTVTGNWKWAQKRSIRNSQWRTGKPWTPTHSGKWRLTGCINGKYYTQEVVVTKADTTRDTFSFTAPVAGNLEYLVFYLYDRTNETLKDTFTPMDVYRRTQADFKKQKETSE